MLLSGTGGPRVVGVWELGVGLGIMGCCISLFFLGGKIQHASAASDGSTHQLSIGQSEERDSASYRDAIGEAVHRNRGSYDSGKLID